MKNYFPTTIEHISCKEQMPLILACMAESQPVVDKWFKAVRGDKRAKAKNPLLKYSIRKFRMEFFNAGRKESGSVKIGSVIIPKEDADKIYALHAWEDTLIHGHVRLMNRVIHRADRDSYLDNDDCMMTATMYLLDAIYQYDGSTKFITYAHHAIYRGVVRALNRAKRNYPWTNRMRELYAEYNATKRKMNRPCNFEEIVETMQLGTDERHALEAALSQVMNQGELVKTEEEETEAFEVVDHHQCLRLDPDQKDAILCAGLDEWETKVLECFLSGHRGWQTEVAENNINPATGKPYSRRAPHVAMERIKEKILQAYEGRRNVA